MAVLAPAAGARRRIAIFDRTWYGRVLVENIEGFCTESDCEINDFEEQLTNNGTVVVKFWLHRTRAVGRARWRRHRHGRRHGQLHASS